MARWRLGRVWRVGVCGGACGVQLLLAVFFLGGGGQTVTCMGQMTGIGLFEI